MQAYRIETTVEQDGALTLHDLPFQEGESIEVIILSAVKGAAIPDPYPLRGTPFSYQQPTEPVADSDWDALT